MHHLYEMMIQMAMNKPDPKPVKKDYIEFEVTCSNIDFNLNTTGVTPLVDGSNVDTIVDWGDGNTDTGNGTSLYFTHNYSDSSTPHTVKITNATAFKWNTYSLVRLILHSFATTCDSGLDLQYAFSGCYCSDVQIPADFQPLGADVKNLYYAFANSNGNFQLHGKASTIMADYGGDTYDWSSFAGDHSRCFQGCTALDDYDQIPSDWKDY